MAGFYDTNISSTYSLRLSGGYGGITDTYTWAVTTTSGLANFPTATHYFDNGSQYYAFSIGTLTPFRNGISTSESKVIAVKNLANSLDNVGNIQVYRDNNYIGNASASTMLFDADGASNGDPCYSYTDTGLNKTSSYTYKIYNAVYGGYTKSYTAPAYCTASTQVGSCCTSSQTCTCGSGTGKSLCNCGSNSTSFHATCDNNCGIDLGVIISCNSSCSTSTATLCLHANTSILLFDGSYKEISKITSDDIVASIIYENDKLSLCSSRVVNKYIARCSSMYKLILINNYEICVTGNHPILTNRGYLTIDPDIKLYDQLTLDDIVITKDGNFGIKSIISIGNDDACKYVYNLYTEHDNFIANNIIVSCENPEVNGYVIYEKTESGIIHNQTGKWC